METKIIKVLDINVALENSRNNIKKKNEAKKIGPIIKAIKSHYELCGINEIIGKK